MRNKCSLMKYHHHVLGLGPYLSHTTNCRGTGCIWYPIDEIQYRCIRRHMSTTGASVAGSTVIVPAATFTLSSCIIS
jgi:hypothetical protein